MFSLFYGNSDGTDWSLGERAVSYFSNSGGEMT